MSASAMIGHLLLECISGQVLPRVPEAAPIMAEPQQVAAFAQGGGDDGILAHIYFLHAAMSAPVIRSGDTVLDLACGPANQLLHIARLHPDVDFIGIDASPAMLETARSTLAQNGIDNVRLQLGDITDLTDIAAAQIDCALCTMSLHHLADTAALQAAMREIGRVVKAGGGIYLADFGRLKRGATQKFFAYDRVELQSRQFTDDFLSSLRAAFSVAEFTAAAAQLGLPVQHYQTALAPFMMICRSAARRSANASFDKALTARLDFQYRNLTPLQRRDFANMARWLRLGGLQLPSEF